MIDPYIFQGFKESYAWVRFFDAVWKSMRATDSEAGPFEDWFCEDGLLSEDGTPVLENGTPKYTVNSEDSSKSYYTTYKDPESGNLIVFIDTLTQVGFAGCQVSNDGNLWKDSEVPTEGRLFIRQQGYKKPAINFASDEYEWPVVDTYLSFQYGKELSVSRASTRIDQVVFVPSKTPTIFTKKKKSSNFLFKDEMERHGIDYEIRLGAQSSLDFSIKDAVRVYEFDGKWFYKTLLPISNTDKLQLGTQTHNILVSDNEIVGVYEEGDYTLVRRNQEYSPEVQSAPEQLNIILKTEEDVKLKKSLAKSLFVREKPFRVQGSVIFIDKTLQAPIQIGAKLAIDRTPSIYFVDEEGNKVSSVNLEWNEGSQVTVYLRYKNSKFWEVESGDSEVGIEIAPSDRGIYGESKIILTALEANRRFEVCNWFKSFICTDAEGQSLEMLPVNLQVNQLEWKPVIVEDYNLLDGVDFADNLAKGEQVDIADQVGFGDSIVTT